MSDRERFGVPSSIALALHDPENQPSQYGTVPLSWSVAHDLSDDESEAVRMEMARLLDGIANALRGEPPPRTRWSWHDLPDRAAAAIASIDVFVRAAAELARSGQAASGSSQGARSDRTRSQKLADAGFTRRPSLWALQAREALELIAAPQRADGSWNRDREACRQLAAEALGRDTDSDVQNGVGVGQPEAPTAAPLDMVLHCPACGLQHIDAPEPAVRTALDPNGVLGWPNPPHRSHLCHGCGHIWRPADVPTNGVAAIKTKGKADSPIAHPPARSGAGSEEGQG